MIADDKFYALTIWIEDFIGSDEQALTIEDLYQRFKNRMERERAGEAAQAEPEQIILRRATDQLPSVPLDLRGVGE